LPNAKELQSIIDYERSPSYTNSAAISEIFQIAEITNEAGEKDYPSYWTSTTHYDGPSPNKAVYVCFGRALGYMNGQWMDVHGAGAQRSDLKDGDPNNYPEGHGPQGDAIRIYNYVRLVRDADITTGIDESDSENLPTDFQLNQNYPNPFNPSTTISFTLPTSGAVSLEIYNMLGQRVATLVNGNLSACHHSYKWNAANFSSGIFYYRLTSKVTSETRKMLLVK
jgi:hypothetical protein